MPDAPAEELGESLDVVVSEAPPAPKRPYTSLAPHQQDFVAMSMLNGVPSDEIARAVGCEPDYIKRLSKGANDSFQRIYEGYKYKLLNAVAGARFKLMEKMDASYAAIDSALNGRDTKVAFEAAKWVLEACVPDLRPKQGGPAGASVNLNLYNTPEVQQLATTTINTVGAAFLDLKRTITGVDLGRHVRTGLEAPTATLMPTADDANGVVDLGVEPSPGLGLGEPVGSA